MSSKRNIRRRLRRKKCEGKIRFGFAREARIEARRIKERFADVLDVYPCEFCGGWHLGHSPARKEVLRANHIRDYTLRRLV